MNNKEEFNNVTQGRVPAEQTLKFIHRAEGKFDSLENMTNQINLRISLMEKDIKNICEKLDQNAEEHKEIMGKIDRFIESADTKYAKSSVEKLVYKLIFGIAIYAVLTIIYFILEHVGLAKP